MFTKGQRVQLHPATDEWMQGDRYGTVVGHGRRRAYTNGTSVTMETPVRVKLDKSGRIVRFHPDNLFPLD